MVVVVLIAVAAVLVAAILGFVVVPVRRRRAPRGPGKVGADRLPADAARSDATTVGTLETPPRAVAVRPGGLGERIRTLFRGGQATEETWRGLRETLIRADVGAAASERIVDRVRTSYRPGQDAAGVVAEEIAALFEGDSGWAMPSGSPAVVMVVGVNGTGKTTTIGKLAALLRGQGRTVTLAASDTFRAAAGEQLDTWAGRAGAHLVSQARGADPGAVAFDAVKAAQARGSDVLIVDTAGRLHTRTPLMDELQKVKRVLEKAGGPPSEVLLVLDATTGQNGIAQARAFTGAVGVTGVVLTKMDGTARGGIVLAVREELGVPVRFVGTGEAIDDLAPFDPGSFARRLVA
jgi:fused signal recognition particle receptor